MKIASFNVQRLGSSKLSDENVVPYLIKTEVDVRGVFKTNTVGLVIKFLVNEDGKPIDIYRRPTRKDCTSGNDDPAEIVSRYSIIVILEVVDKKGKAMESFLQRLNSTGANKKHPYRMVMSSSLGRSLYKEQFACLYRPDQVKLIDTYQYEDNQEGDEDAFSREPFILRFSLSNMMVNDLVLIPVHTKPKDSQKEIDELYDVCMEVKKKWHTENIMFLGDFNADGAYVSKKKMKKIRIRTDEDFHWLIEDDVDTTASLSNDYTYDRIVVYKDKLLKAIVKNSAKPFNFHEAYKLSVETALDISDHYPVEVSLRKKPVKRPRSDSRAAKRKAS